MLKTNTTQSRVNCGVSFNPKLMYTVPCWWDVAIPRLRMSIKRGSGALSHVPKRHQLLFMTERRQLVLDFIRAYIRLHGVPPSYEVIAKGIGLSSKSNVHRIVHRLKEDGHLTIRPYKFHSIKLVDASVKTVMSL